MNQIFSGRVKDYQQYRTDYPPALQSFIVDQFTISQKEIVADIGSGTGLLARWFLELGNQVYGVEPNDEMRALGEKLLFKFDRFISIDASAENTLLPDKSVDLVVVGNAFHWFDHRKTRREFGRILKANGRILLIRTNWADFSSLAMQEYRKLVDDHCLGRRGAVSDTMIEEKKIRDFFSPGSFIKHSLDGHEVLMSLEQLKGRFCSTSFSPTPKDPNYDAAMMAIELLFGKYQQDGYFRFGMITNLAYGQIYEDGP